MEIVFTGRQTNNLLFFYKVETYLECLFEPKIYAIPNFVTILRAVLENINQSLGQIDNLIFYKAETYLDPLLMPEIYAMPNFMKIVRAVLENVYIYAYIYI